MMNLCLGGEGAPRSPVQRLGRQEEEEESEREARQGAEAEQGGLLGLGRQEIRDDGTSHHR